MNFKRTVAIGLVAMQVGFFGMKSADAKSPSATQEPSSYIIAQVTDASSPVYGAWKLSYSISGIIYESVLVMDGYKGAMRTQYFNAEAGKTDVVDQTMQLKSSASGLILLGSNPVYVGTKRRHRTYSPDNFLFQVQPSGTAVVWTCDDARRCSPVNLEKIRL